VRLWRARCGPGNLTGRDTVDRPVTPEAHTEQVCVADLEAVLAAADAPFALSKEEVEEICRRVRAPLLIVHDDDAASPTPERSAWPSSPARRWSPS
jgi:hypothetical protein